MGLFPKLLFGLMLVLPGGFVIGPVVLLVKRWHDRRSEKPQQIQAFVQQAPRAELPQPTPPIEHRAAA